MTDLCSLQGSMFHCHVLKTCASRGVDTVKVTHLFHEVWPKAKDRPGEMHVCPNITKEEALVMLPRTSRALAAPILKDTSHAELASQPS